MCIKMSTTQLIEWTLFFLLILGSGYCDNNDEYEWNEQAKTWLKYFPIRDNWENAMMKCHSEGAILASPLNYKLKKAIEWLAWSQKFPNMNETTIFIGVHTPFPKGDYFSVEGVPLSQLEISWATGEPNNYPEMERCVTMTIRESHGTMADTRCDDGFPFICYKQHNQSPNPEKVYRSDYEWSEEAGGWLKYHVVPATQVTAKQRCQTEGAVVAFPSSIKLWKAMVKLVQRQRGHIDDKGVFLFAGVNVTKLSTKIGSKEHSHYSSESLLMTVRYNDGSTVSTYIPFVKAPNELSYICYKEDVNLTITECGTSDTEYVLEAKTGSCYKFHNKGLDWSEAYMTCAGEGGHLVIINDDVEAGVIKDIITKHPENKIDAKVTNETYVGFYSWDRRGQNFMTVHGESLKGLYNNSGDKNYTISYDNINFWRGNSPNSRHSRFEDKQKHCGTVRRDMVLNDIECNNECAFICEKNPKSLLNN